MARLNRDGTRVVCNQLDCGRIFGRIAVVEGERWLLMEPGWLERYYEHDEHVWERSVRQRRPAGASVRYRVVYFPVEAICPDCGFRQALDGAALGLKSLPLSALERRYPQEMGKPSRLLTWRAIDEKEAMALLDSTMNAMQS